MLWFIGSLNGLMMFSFQYNYIFVVCYNLVFLDIYENASSPIEFCVFSVFRHQHFISIGEKSKKKMNKFKKNNSSYLHELYYYYWKIKNSWNLDFTGTK